MALGDLTIRLAADVAQFQSDMGKAAHIAEQNSRRIEKFASNIKTTISAALAGLSAGFFVDYARDLVKGIAALDDLAEKTGASVEALSKLEQVARIGGHSMETIESAVIRLNKALSGVSDEETKGAGKALAAIGLSADELRRKDPAEALRVVAVELNKFADGGGKSALAMDLLGKAGAQALPFLKDLATEQGIASRVTAEQAAKAEELEKQIRRITSASLEAKRELASSLIPTIANAIEQFTEGTKAAGGFANAILKLGTINPFRDTAGNLRAYREELADLERDRARQVKAGPVDVSGLDTAINTTKARIEFLKTLQRQEALALGGGDSVGEQRRFFQKPVLDYSPVKDLAKNAKADMDYVREVFKAAGADLEKFAASEKRALDSLLAETDLAKFQKLEASIKLLDNAFFSGVIGVQQYEQALSQLLGKSDKLTDELTELKALIAQTDFGKTEELLRKIGIADRALFDGLVNDDVHAQIIRQLTETKDTHKKVTDEVQEFWRSAAENMQQSMSSFFFDAMQGNLKDLGGSFTRTIDKMIADILAARVATELFGKDFAKGGDLGGLIGKGVGLVAGLFTGGSSYADLVGSNPILGTALSLDEYAMGTDYVPQTGLYTLHKGEAVVPANQNMGGRSSVTQIFNFAAPTDRRTMSQVAAEAQMGLARAQRNL